MSKGSGARPLSVPQDTFDNNFDAIFRKPDPREVDDAQAENEAFEEIENRNSSKVEERICPYSSAGRATVL